MIEFWKSKITGTICSTFHWTGEADCLMIKMFFDYLDFADKPKIMTDHHDKLIITTAAGLELIYDPGSYFMIQANKLLSMSEEHLKKNYTEVNVEPTVIKIDTKGLSLEEAIDKVKDAYDKLSEAE